MSNPEYNADGSYSRQYQAEQDREESVEDWLETTANGLLDGKAFIGRGYALHMNDVLAEADQISLVAHLIVIHKSSDPVAKLDMLADLFNDCLHPAARIVAARILPKVIIEVYPPRPEVDYD